MIRRPAEWEHQSAVMLTWPHADTDWAADLAAVEAVYARLAAVSSAHEPVLVVARDALHGRHISELIRAAGARVDRIRLVECDSDDTWARDHGPISVERDGSPGLIDFRFDGWGGKYAAERDDAINGCIYGAGVFDAEPPVAGPLVLEGGAIESDGRGTLLAVRRTVAELRNPDWSLPEIERELAKLLGIEHFIWLEHGELAGDDTDGHIDTLARFTAPDTICHVRCDDPADGDYAALRRMGKELACIERPEGGRYRLAPLPHPKPIEDADGRRLPATYANFLIINGAVLAPVYDDPADRLALSTISGLFPERRIEPIDCRPLIKQGGSLHCITMQLHVPLTPAVPPEW